MYLLSNKDKEEIITLLSILQERDKFIPEDLKNTKEKNFTRRAALLKRKLKSKKNLTLKKE